MMHSLNPYSLKLFKFEDIFRINSHKLYYKYKQQNLPLYFMVYFIVIQLKQIMFVTDLTIFAINH